jgi:stage II sporulation protein AA (anti-sigma F factor antagonist)
VTIFEVHETELRPGCRVIKLDGELDLAVADQLAEAFERAKDYRLVLGDLTSCEFVDSTGIALFVRMHKELTQEGRVFAVFGANDQVLRVLSVTGLTENGLVFESAEEALAALAPSADT